VRSVEFPGADYSQLQLQSSLATKRHAWAAAQDALVSFAFFLVAFITRFPFHSKYLSGWDTSQFVLGTYHFDILNHQPHPPGCILYVGLLHHLISVIHDESISIGLLSATFSALSVVLVFLLALEILAVRRTAYLAAWLWLVNPLMWHYSLTGDVYPAGAFGGLLTVLCVHRFWTRPSERTAIFAAGAFAFSSGMRQDQVLYFVPLLLFPFWRCKPCRRFFPLLLAVAFLGYLSWYIPMLVLAGGYQAYSHALSVQFLLTVQRTSVLFGGAPSVHARMAVRMLGALAIGMSAALILLPLLIRHPAKTLTPLGLTREQELFILVWIAPALVFMGLIHFGRGGYLLPFLPAAIIILAHWVTLQIPPPPQGRRLFLAATLLPALAQTYFFFATPGLGARLPAEPEGLPGTTVWQTRLQMIPHMLGLEVQTYVDRGVRDADAIKDVYFPSIRSALRKDPTIVLSFEPGMWRVLMNYFPDVPMYAVFGFDRPIPERLGRPGPMVVALGYERETRILYDGTPKALPTPVPSISLAGRESLLVIVPADLGLEFVGAASQDLRYDTLGSSPPHLRVYRLISLRCHKGNDITIRSKSRSILLRP